MTQETRVTANEPMEPIQMKGLVYFQDAPPDEYGDLTGLEVADLRHLLRVARQRFDGAVIHWQFDDRRMGHLFRSDSDAVRFDMEEGTNVRPFGTIFFYVANKANSGAT